MPPNILIISFYFPPYPKVGGRRWVKFAKYLNRAGIKINILTAQMNVDKQSPWDNDADEIEHLTKRIYYSYDIPYYKKVLPNDLFSKIKWHLSKIINEKIAVKKVASGNPADDSEKYINDFVKEAEKIIKLNNINVLIYTGTPFHLSHGISKLKHKYKDIKFVFDLRDLWSDWMSGLNSEQMNFERKLEQETISNSDVIITPAERIKEIIESRYKALNKKVITIPHAYDPDDFRIIMDIKPLKKEVINLVYAGSMYPNMEDNMRLLAYLLKSDKRINLYIYTFSNDYKEYFEDPVISSRVIYKKPLPIKAFVDEVVGIADAMLYMRSSLSNDSDFLSTKFFDFLPLKKPIIYLGKEGDAAKFIYENNIGFHLIKNNSNKLEELLASTSEGVKVFDHSKYSFQNVTNQLIKICES